MPDRQLDTDFTPISPNPFIVGNPVRDRAMFFGREAEFELVRRQFQHSRHGGLLVFCGERRSGKTSILFQILDRRLGPDFIPVLIDMQSMAVVNEVEFLTRVSEYVLAAVGQGETGSLPATETDVGMRHDGSALTRPDFTTDSNRAGVFQKFIQNVLEGRPGKKLILLFDEYELFEDKIDKGQLAHDVLHILAGLMEHQPVFLIFTGSQHLEQRRKDYWKILAKSRYKMISFLERDDALSLMHKPVEGRVHYAAGTVDGIYRLTAGQPFYTQAICQSLVDQLNERRTNHATPAIVADVVDGIVNNPLPQMIFLWDGLERDEKLVLALVAESLPDAGASAAVTDLERLRRQRQYPVALERAGIATTLEKLFKSEMLLRSDHGSLPAYAFRMDLWRLWVRRQHSFWQVMRELGIEIRPARRRGWWAIGVGAVLAVAMVLGWVLRPKPRAPVESTAAPPASTARFALEANPANAMIRLDGRPMGTGRFAESITSDRDHRFLLSAEGYADSEVVVRLAAGDSGSRNVRLRELLGDLRIETQPAGAEITVDGRRVGRSPLSVNGLGAATTRRVTASLDGYGAVHHDATVRPGDMTPVRLTLERGRGGVYVTSEPSAGEIRLDGTSRGRTPLNLSVPFGSHTMAVLREGFQLAETTMTIGPETREVHLVLRREPPGILVVQGDRPARIYVDGVIVAEDLQNSGRLELAGGTHQVQVVLRSGETVDSSLVVRSRERTIFDYSRRTVTRRSEGGQ
jgi:PEGA domain-containing protein